MVGLIDSSHGSGGIVGLIESAEPSAELEVVNGYAIPALKTSATTADSVTRATVNIRGITLRTLRSLNSIALGRIGKGT